MRRIFRVLKSMVIFIFILFVPVLLFAQSDYKTLLPVKTVNAIINEVSGSLPYNIMSEIAAFNRDRKSDEYKGTYWESEVIIKYARQFGYSDIKIESFPSSFMGRKLPQWDGEVGELWMVSPKEKLIISHRDIPAALAEGSKTADVTAELIYVGSGIIESDYEGIDVTDKIVLASGNGGSWSRATGQVYGLAVTKFGARGVIVFQVARPYDRPDQIPWAGVGGGFFGGPVKEGTFGFNLPYRIGDDLRNRLLRGEKIKVRANVKSAEYETDNEVPAMIIPGTGDTKDEVCLVAHLFEGVTKQGANDNISGCVAILEAGRTLLKLVKEGKIDPPKRTIRFLHVPEIMSSFQYLEKYPEIENNMIAAINLDMVGEDMFKNNTSFHLISTLHSMQTYINDIAEHYFDYTGFTSTDGFLKRAKNSPLLPIIDPAGSRDPFYYQIDPYSGGSDHIVFQMPKYKVPCIFYNNWPDMHYHTNEDRPDKSDPTQLKRAAFLAAIVAYNIASAGPEDVPGLISELSGRGESRIGKEMTGCLNALIGAGKNSLDQVYKEQDSKIYWIHKREKRNILSLHDFAGNAGFAKNLINDMAATVMENSKAAQAQLKKFYSSLCKKHNKKPVKIKLTAGEKTASEIIPSELNYTMGLMGLFGAREKGIPSQMVPELFNFIDGKMTVLDIRNAAAAEFKPVKIENVTAFFEKYEKQKVVTLKKK